MLPDRTMVFEFALAGYRDTDISLEFQGENMVLSAEAPDQTVEGDDVIFFNRRLKYKTIPEQKYYVPEDKFDREAAKAVWKKRDTQGDGSAAGRGAEPAGRQNPNHKRGRITCCSGYSSA
jgi:hypothetical protein